MLRKENKRKSRGWVPFGYNYLGPGNDLYRGKPTNKADAAAQKHDWEYHFLSKRRKGNPKLYYSDADDVFMDEVGDDDPIPWAAKKLFEMKRWFADNKYIEDYRIQQKNERETTLANPFTYITPPKKRKRDPIFTPGERIKSSRLNNPLLVSNPNRSLSNLLSSAATNTMAGDNGNNGGSGNAQGLSETQVDPVYQVYRGPPDHTYASLPYFRDYTAGVAMWAHDFTWRPTSVYDCFVDLNTVTDVNAGAGTQNHYASLAYNVSDSVIDKARWFDYYASIYKYYHVVACKYEIFVENKCNEDLYCHLMAYNDIPPPIQATNRDMMCWADCETQVLSPVANAIVVSNGTVETQQAADNAMNDEDAATVGTTANAEAGEHINNNVGQKTCMFTGTYRTGDYSRQIRLDSQVENWTAVTTNPTLNERLLLRVKPYWDSSNTNDANTRQRTCRFVVRSKLEYLVEFKELKDGLKYPINDQPYTATIANTN